MEGNWYTTTYPHRGQYAGPDRGGFYGGYSERLHPQELRHGLRELLTRIRQYDGLRLDMEMRGGRLSQLTSIANLLRAPLNVKVGGQKQEVNLVDQLGLRSALLRLDGDIHLQVRLKSTHMPVYYVCRTKTDYWNEYSLIAEDYYQSPGYPLADDRFARLMRTGHEKDFLRLSRFRDEVKQMLFASRQMADDLDVDDQLHLLGRHVFQAAWHRDQQLGVTVSRHLQLPLLGQAVELLYLCLSGELCELRSAATPLMMRFFHEIYPHPAIERLLNLLPNLSGEALTNLPQRALAQHAKLSRGFSRFLAQEVPWRNTAQPIPLWKLIYANLDRLDTVRQRLAGCRELAYRRKELEGTAEAVIANLLSQQG